MSELKKHNSIIFLTTLSVYLGLVLVGGAGSPVLAQAALTRNFDIQEEIEYKDDLDKKPDDEKIDFSKTLDTYFKNVDEYFKNLKSLSQIEKFDFDYDVFEYEAAFLHPRKNGTAIIRSENLTQNVNNYWLNPAITDVDFSFESWEFLSDYLDHTDYKSSDSKKSNLKLSYDKSELKIEVSAFKSNNQRADWLARQFNQSLNKYQIDDKDKIVNQIHKYTTIKAENNQVFLITNLPRASINSLFAKKDANQAASEK